MVESKDRYRKIRIIDRMKTVAAAAVFCLDYRMKFVLYK